MDRNIRPITRQDTKNVRYQVVYDPASTNRYKIADAIRELTEVIGVSVMYACPNCGTTEPPVQQTLYTKIQKDAVSTEEILINSYVCPRCYYAEIHGKPGPTPNSMVLSAGMIDRRVCE